MFKTTKAKVISVSVFCIICITITLSLILYKNIEIDNEMSDGNVMNGEELNSKDIQGIELKSTYNQNDLRIQENKVSKEKVEINYLQISGLKNKIIQDNINRELEKAALNFYREKVKDVDEVISVSVNMSNTGNFSNIVSFELSYWAKIDDDGDGFYQDTKGINYNLATGEEISIDNMFTPNAPIYSILRKSVYYSLVQENLEKSLSGEMKVADYGNIEDEVVLFINKYKKGKINNFFISPKCIGIYYEDNKIIEIDMKKYADYIAIYNRYLTDESIFETNNVGLKNLYTLSERSSIENRTSIYEKGSNYFIDINIDNSNSQENEISKVIIQNKVSEIKAEIEKIKSIASRNTNNYYILNYYIHIYTSLEESTQQILTYCETIGNSYEMTVHDFEENIETIIIEYNRANITGEYPNYIYDFTNVLKVEPQRTVEYYIPETGEKVVV